MTKYRHKPVNAIKWTGKNMVGVMKFCGKDRVVFPQIKRLKGVVNVVGNHGFINVVAGDYIIKGIHGELYPCNAYVFELTYEEE